MIGVSEFSTHFNRKVVIMSDIISQLLTEFIYANHLTFLDCSVPDPNHALYPFWLAIDYLREVDVTEFFKSLTPEQQEYITPYL